MHQIDNAGDRQITRKDAPQGRSKNLKHGFVVIDGRVGLMGGMKQTLHPRHGEEMHEAENYQGYQRGPYRGKRQKNEFKLKES